MNNIHSAFLLVEDGFFSDAKRCEVVEDIYQAFKAMHDDNNWDSLRYLPSGTYLSDNVAELNDGSHRDMIVAINCVLANGDSSSFDL